MSSSLSIQQIRALPKIDLHRHLDCSMRWSTMLEIASTLKIDFPKKPQLQQEHFLITQPMVNLEQVLKKFLTAQQLLASEEILERLAYEACEDAFNDGVRIVEFRYAPTFITHGHQHLTNEKIHQSFLKGLSAAEKKWPIATGLIGILQRTLSNEINQTVMDFIIENKNTFIGVDLADSEESGEPEKFQHLFEKAHHSGLPITIHAGETPSVHSEKRLLSAIDMLHARRIGHGVQSILSEKVIQTLIDRTIMLEICPYSNYLTKAFDQLKNNPLKTLKDKGVTVSINSDDPGIFNSTLTDDYMIAQNELGLHLDDFQQCLTSAYNHSFIKEDKKKKAWLA